MCERIVSSNCIVIIFLNEDYSSVTGHYWRRFTKSSSSSKILVVLIVVVYYSRISGSDMMTITYVFEVNMSMKAAKVELRT